MNVKTATTAELLAYYNAHSGKAQVKRFADRKTAERRVAELLAAAPAPKKPAKAPKAAYEQIYANGVPQCPQCGNHDDITCGDVVATRSGERIVNEHIAMCHHCGHEWDIHTGKPRRRHADKVAGQRAAAIAASWKVASVAAARAARHGVRVTAPDGKHADYSSVREAFLQLALPIGQHIKFRGQLKAAGKADFGGYKFRLVERSK